jgi:hypothetical protein
MMKPRRNRNFADRYPGTRSVCARKKSEVFVVYSLELWALLLRIPVLGVAVFF